MNILDILLSPRYLALFVFAHKQSQGKSKSVQRTLFRDSLSDSTRRKVSEAEKADLLIGIYKKVNNPLQKIVFAHLLGEKVVLETLVPEEEYQYLLVKIFSEKDSCQSHKLESLVTTSFRELDAEALTRRQVKKPPGKFQDIVNLARSIIDDLGNEVE